MILHWEWSAISMIAITSYEMVREIWMISIKYIKVHYNYPRVVCSIPISLVPFSFSCFIQLCRIEFCKKSNKKKINKRASTNACERDKKKKKNKNIQGVGHSISKKIPYFFAILRFIDSIQQRPVYPLSSSRIQIVIFDNVGLAILFINGEKKREFFCFCPRQRARKQSSVITSQD